MWEHSGAIAAEESALDSDPLGSGIYGIIWITKKYPFFIKQRPCNGNFAFCFRARSILHNYYRVYFCCVGKII